MKKYCVNEQYESMNGEKIILYLLACMSILLYKIGMNMYGNSINTKFAFIKWNPSNEVREGGSRTVIILTAAAVPFNANRNSENRLMK